MGSHGLELLEQGGQPLGFILIPVPVPLEASVPLFPSLEIENKFCSGQRKPTCQGEVLPDLELGVSLTQ